MLISEVHKRTGIRIRIPATSSTCDCSVVKIRSKYQVQSNGWFSLNFENYDDMTMKLIKKFCLHWRVVVDHSLAFIFNLKKIKKARWWKNISNLIYYKIIQISNDAWCIKKCTRLTKTPPASIKILFCKVSFVFPRFSNTLILARSHV